MATLKACKQCRTLFEGSKCSSCESISFSDSFKGKIYILQPEQSEIARNLKLTKKGFFAIRLR